MGRLLHVLMLFAVATTPGCVEPEFRCAGDEDCKSSGKDGVCAWPGYCAFDDASCDTSLAYGDLAPKHLAGRCVPGDAVPSSDSSGGDGSTGTSRPETDEGAGESSSSDAALCPVGSPCDPIDPCATSGQCDDDGVCLTVDLVVCDDPPSDCHEPVGTCSSGTCEYAPLPPDTRCSDADDCTVGDACDGLGACTAGPVCPNDDPCQSASCDAGACVVQPVADGTSCGDAPANRCCGGACVDISSDTQHCGGCNTACAAGLDCESVSETATCESAPAATSGRCLCQFSNAQCPNGQICRTYSPFTDRCVPPDPANCDGTAVYQNACPSYCSYD